MQPDTLSYSTSLVAGYATSDPQPIQGLKPTTSYTYHLTQVPVIRKLVLVDAETFKRRTRKLLLRTGHG